MAGGNDGVKQPEFGRTHAAAATASALNEKFLQVASAGQVGDIAAKEQGMYAVVACVATHKVGAKASQYRPGGPEAQVISGGDNGGIQAGIVEF